MSFLRNFLGLGHGEQIRPELIVAFNSRIPNEISVNIYPSKDGGYIAEVKDIDHCLTQVESGKDLVKMVNDAMHTSLDIPEEYRDYVVSYLPPKEVQEKFDIKIPGKYLNRELIMQKARV